MNAAQAPATPGRSWLAVLVLVLAALGLRGGALWLGRDALEWNDQITYKQRAEDLLDGKGYTGSYQSWALHKGLRKMRDLPRYLGAYQAPGYAAFIALVMKVCGRELIWVKLAQVLLGAATVWLVYALGRDAVSHLAGLCAGWLYALDPTLIAFTHYIFTETLFLFLFTAGLWLWMRPTALGVFRAVLAGVSFALAAYVKSSVLYLLPLLGLWLVWRERERRAQALRFCAIAALAWVACVAPWTLRNIQVHGGFVLMDSSGPFNLWRGNQPNAYQRRLHNADWNMRHTEPFEAYTYAPVAEVGGSAAVDIAREMFETDTPTDLQVMEAAQKSAVRYALDDLGWTARRAFYKYVDLWNPTSFVMRHLERDGYGPISPATAAALSWACVLSYALVWCLALPSLWRRANTALGVMALMLVYYYTLIHMATFGLTRFRLPVMPILMVLAGATFAAWWERRRRPASVLP